MSDPLCARCDHPLSKHCPGNQKHTCPKEDSRSVPLIWRKSTITCRMRHCLNPLCSCIEFVKEAA